MRLPIGPKLPGLARIQYVTSNSFFDQESLPVRLVVIGGGYIGLELGQGAQRLGSAVTIVHTHDRILEREDPNASAAVQRSLERDGVRFVFDAKIREVGQRDGTIAVALDDGTTLECDGLLVATGRAPNSEALRPQAGFYQLVVDATSGEIVGATLVGYEAGEIVHTLGFASHMGATWRDLDSFVAIHPTFGEGLPSLARLPA